MVGAVGFEPTISCSQSTCDARLRYTPSGSCVLSHNTRHSADLTGLHRHSIENFKAPMRVDDPGTRLSRD
jgi:hypothetical protein